MKKLLLSLALSLFWTVANAAAIPYFTGPAPTPADLQNYINILINNINSQNISSSPGTVNLNGNEVFSASAGIIAKLGSITGGSNYTSGSAIFTLNSASITAGSGCSTTGPFVFTSVALTDSTTPAANGAIATVTTYNGGVVAVAITNPGPNNAGYLVGDSLTGTVGTCTGWSIPVLTTGATYSLPFTGGSGINATGTFQVISTGTAVSNVTLGNPGTGYSSTDNLSANVPGGSGFSIAISAVGQTSGPGTGGGMWLNGTNGIIVSGVSADNNFAYASEFSINNSSDSSNVPNGFVAFGWNQNYGPGKGSIKTGQFILNLVQTPNDIGAFYSVLNTIMQSGVNVGGTSGAGNGKSDIFGFNPYARLVSGGTFYHQVVGEEADISIRYGASSDESIGIQVVQDAAFKVAPLIHALGFSINNASGAIGHDIGYADGSYDGNPSLKSTGELIACWPHGALTNTNGVSNTGNCGTIYALVDGYNYSTISGYLLRGAQGASFITGAGVATLSTVNVTGSTAPSIGIYSPAASVGGLSAASGSDIVNYGQTSSVNWLIIGGQTAQLQAGDGLEIRASAANAQGALFKNASAVSGAQAYLDLGNNTSNTEFSITLNGSATVTGNGANSSTINGAAGLWLQNNGTNVLALATNLTTFTGTLMSAGTAPTLTTGTCSGSSWSGGATAGKFTAATCSAGTYILSGLPAATNGYECDAQDETTPADTLKQTAFSTTSVTLTSTTVASDAVVVKCLAF